MNNIFDKCPLLISDNYWDQIEFKDLEPIEGEEWNYLSSNAYPNIVPRYVISTKGRVYDYKNKRLVSPFISNTGYVIVNLWEYETDEVGKTTTIHSKFSMHRLLMSVFRPIDNPNELVINHIDSNRINNDLDNLEWCTISHNHRHAILNNRRPNVYIDEATAEEVCKLWVTGKYNSKQIADMLGIKRVGVLNITTGEAWTHISKKYNFNDRISHILKRQDLENLCIFFETHDRNNYVSERKYVAAAIEETGFQPLDGSIPTENKNIVLIKRILNRKNFKELTEKYNF